MLFKLNKTFLFVKGNVAPRIWSGKNFRAIVSKLLSGVAVFPTEPRKFRPAFFPQGNLRLLGAERLQNCALKSGVLLGFQDYRGGFLCLDPPG